MSDLSGRPMSVSTLSTLSMGSASTAHSGLGLTQFFARQDSAAEETNWANTIPQTVHSAWRSFIR